MTTTKEVTLRSIINGLSLPTLEDISILALAIGLLEEEEVKKIYCQHFQSMKYNMSLKKVSKLTSVCKSLKLPEIIEAKLVSVFHWIRKQYYDWIQYVTQELPQLQQAFPKRKDYITHIMNSIKWTNGIIDREKSMCQVVCDVEHDGNLKAIFRKASRFCLEDVLKIVWGKMSDAEKNDKPYLSECDVNSYFSLYWTCKMKGDMKEFMQNIPDYLKRRNCYEAVRDDNLINYALILNIFQGEFSGMKYFYKVASVDTKHLVHIIKIFLKETNWRYGHQSEEKLLFLLSKIEDEGILKEIFHEFFEVFLKISVGYWPWHKFFLTLSRMFAERIDGVLFYELINKLMDDVENEKVDVFEVKMLWKDSPIEVKRSFCSFISNKQKDTDVKAFWRKMTIEIFDMFLKEEEIRNILTPYENFGISEYITTGRYDLIEFWVQKVLVSEEAIVSYLKNFIQTKSVAIIKTLQRHPLSRVNQFLDWAFKYEDLMDKDEILKCKDEAINQDIVAMFVRGFRLKKWEDLEKLVDWMVKGRKNEYQKELVNWKEKAVKEFFKKPHIDLLSSYDFKNSFCKFLNYGVNNSEKIKVMMSKVNLNEGEICSGHLKSDFDEIDSYLRILERYGKDMISTKKNIFFYIFSWLGATDFANEKLCENMGKLLYWNCKSDKEVKEVKKEIIDKYALETVLVCLRNKHDIAMNNILKFLFEVKEEDEEWSKVLFDWKMRVIEYKKFKFVWEKKDYYDMMTMLINYKKENENVRKGIWDLKKKFIECLKNNIPAEIIPELILEWNFVPSFFNGDEANADFEKILWDLKEFLLEKMGSEDYEFTCKLFQDFKHFTDFLNWNGSDKAWITDLKKKIFDIKGVRCCLSWILNDKFEALSEFLNWCVADDLNCDMKSNISKLKSEVLDDAISKPCEKWEEEYFQRLERFLLLQSNGDEKELKRFVVEKHGVKSCVKCFIFEYLNRVEAFVKWAEIKGEESIETFKRNILTEILEEEYRKHWKDTVLNFRQCLDEFLYDYGDPDPVKIANMKLDHLEEHFFIIFGKLLEEKDKNNLKGFVKWSFDERVKSGECLPRSKKLISQMFEKFGKEYCAVMLTASDLDAVTDFWDLFFESKAPTKLELWTFKKDCINQFLKNYIERDVYYYNPSLENSWNCFNKFMSSGPGLSSSKHEIFEYKDFVAQEYGIVIMEKYFKSLLMSCKHVFPKNFLKWLFGVKNRKCKTEQKLVDFKKQVLERLIDVKNQDLLEESGFYEALEEFLNFNLIVLGGNGIRNLTKSVIESQGMELCINLMCQNNVATLRRFLRWAQNSFHDNFVDFKQAVILQLAGNSMRVYSWESLQFFLKDGFSLNDEGDVEKYSTLKKFVCDSCSVDICYNWILNNRWDEITPFLEWSFEDSDCKKLKLELLKKHGAQYCNAIILESDWEKLEKFLDWAFGSHEKNGEREEEIINLKIKTLSSDIFYKNHSEILLLFLEWGFNSKANLNKFKKSILSKEHPLNFFVRKQKYKTQKQFQLWFVNKK